MAGFHDDVEAIKICFDKGKNKNNHKNTQTFKKIAVQQKALALPNNGNETMEIKMVELFCSYIFPCVKLVAALYTSFGLFTLPDTDFDPDPGVDTCSKNG